MTKFYVQTQPDGTITDIIDYKHGSYVEIEVEHPLPVGVLGGWFKLENGKIVEYPDLKPKNKDAEITELKEQLADLWQLILLGGASDV